MRRRVWLAVFVLLPFIPVQAYAYSPDEKAPDQQSITDLRTRISQAQPREQCYLYAELIHQMTEFSVHQYAAGDVEKADDMLKQIQAMAHKLHLSVSDDDKRLKSAEILLRHTAFRLNEMLHSSSFEDRPLVQDALAQVNRADSEAMLQVFKK